MFSATEEQEGWRTPDPSWLEMEAADDGEIFFINTEEQEGWRTPDPHGFRSKPLMTGRYSSST
jgi:hypothetical protein